MTKNTEGVAPAAPRPPRRRSYLTVAASADGDQVPAPLPEVTPAITERRRATLELEAVEELNLTHAAVRVGGNVAVIAEEPDGSFCLTTMRGLSEWLAYRPLWLPVTNERTGRQEKRRTDRALVWKGHADRRNVRGLQFGPGTDLGPDFYNTWRGWGIEPLLDGAAAAAPILDHIKHVWCGSDPILTRWVLCWFAQMVQQPINKPGTALVLRGEEGTGKGVLAGRLMRRLLQGAFVQITQPSQVTGKFNAIWQSKLVVFADESFWAGDKPSEGILKALITEPKLNVEFKGKDIFEVDHHARVIFASNNDWVIPAGMDARRWCVLDVANTYRNNATYHSALLAAVEGEGARSFFGFLQTYDLTGVNLRQPPITAALLDQKIRGLDSVPAWWRERLWAGYIDNPDSTGTSDDEGAGWPGVVTCSRLYASYLARCKRLSVRYPEGEEGFARELRKLAKFDRKRGSRDDSGKRPWQYAFIDDGVSLLDYLRGQLERCLGGALDWDGDEPRHSRTTAASAPSFLPASDEIDSEIPW